MPGQFERRRVLLGFVMIPCMVAIARANAGLPATDMDAMRRVVGALGTGNGDGLVAAMVDHIDLVIHYDMTGAGLMDRKITRKDLADNMASKGDIWFDLMGGRASGIDCFADWVTQSAGQDWNRVAPGRFVPPGQQQTSLTFLEFFEDKGGWVLVGIGYPVA